MCAALGRREGNGGKMLKRKLKYLLRKRRLSEAEQTAAKMSLNNLDDKLGKYLNFTDGFFVEAGANDGINQSNTFYLERCFGWKGILIEPIPAAYEMCRIHRARCQVVNKALVSRDFPEDRVQLHYANLMSLVDGAKEQQDEHIRKGIECQNLPGTYEVETPAATLSEVLKACEPHPPIDFFSLDVEGYELEVLKGIDEKDWPRWLLIETVRLDEVQRFLGSRYRLVEKLTVHDYLFRRK
jgi:FkbM family methyltransferase